MSENLCYEYWTEYKSKLPEPITPLEYFRNWLQVGSIYKGVIRKCEKDKDGYEPEQEYLFMPIKYNETLVGVPIVKIVSLSTNPMDKETWFEVYTKKGEQDKNPFEHQELLYISNYEYVKDIYYQILGIHKVS